MKKIRKDFEKPAFKQRNRGKTHKLGSSAYWIFGNHACILAINNPNREIKRVLVTKNSVDRLTNSINNRDFNLEIVTGDAIEKHIADGAVHQNIACEILPLKEISLHEITDNAKRIVLLDQVTDPHNIGAIARSAAAFDIDAVILTKNHSPNETATMAKIASGALEIVPLVKITNLVATIELLKKENFWILGLDGDAHTELSKAPKYEKVAIVMGAEGKGLRKLTREHCDLIVSLPISAQIESLNVSNAAAIAFYELASGRK